MHKYFVNRLVSVITATTAVMWMSAVAVPSAQTEGVNRVRGDEPSLRGSHADQQKESVRFSGRCRTERRRRLSGRSSEDP